MAANFPGCAPALGWAGHDSMLLFLSQLFKAEACVCPLPQELESKLSSCSNALRAASQRVDELMQVWA